MSATPRQLAAASAVLLWLLAASPAPAQEEPGVAAPAAGADDARDDGNAAASVETILVTARRVALEVPASTYASPVTALRYDPRIDV